MMKFKQYNNETGYITMVSIVIKKIRKYYKQLYVNKFYLDDKLLENSGTSEYSLFKTK